MKDMFERESRMLLELALQELSPKDEFVVRRRLGVGTKRQTLNSIGQQLSVTKERVRQRELRGRKRMLRFIWPDGE